MSRTVPARLLLLLQRWAATDVVKKGAKEGLSVALLDGEEVAKWINGRTHWVLVFGHSALDGVDEFDKFLNVYPTYPTLFTLKGSVTFVPKSALSSEGLEAWLCERKPGTRVADEQDIVLITRDEEADQYLLTELVMQMAGRR